MSYSASTTGFHAPLPAPGSGQPLVAPHTTNLRVVIADDSAVARRTLQLHLEKWGYSVQVASDGLQAWTLLQAADVPTIAILDWMMPGLEGVEICQRIRQLPRQHYIYSMLVTGKSDKGDLIEGLRAGADDYLMKPFDPDEMEARLLVAERILKVQEELVAAREAMQSKALHDSLTRLLNRGAIMGALEQEISRSRRENESFSVILADIDHFKQINDTYGHLSGDEVLVEVASRIRSSLRSHDAVGRYGGEEFLIVVPGCGPVAASQVAEKIRRAIANAAFELGGRQKNVTISVGVNTWRQQSSVEELLSAADAALYRAKASGRNRVEVAETLSDPRTANKQLLI